MSNFGEVNTTTNGTNSTPGTVATVTALQQDSGIPTDIKIGITSAYALIFVIALFGNSFGLFVVLKKTSSTNTTNLFIVNMAIADLLLTLTVMPFSVAYFYRDTLWFGGVLGTITCKALFYVIPVSIAATVFTMMIISFDRFYAVFYPLKEKIFQRPKILSAIIWVLSFVLMFPYVFLFQVEFYPSLNAYYCIQEWTWEDPNDSSAAETYRVLTNFHITLFVIIYALPLSITVAIYFLICRKLMRRKIPGNLTDNIRALADKSKRRVMRLLFIICVVFALCWFPTYVNHYFWYVHPDQTRKLPTRVEFIFTWIAHANSAINPCLYILLNRKFRKELFAIFNALPCIDFCPRRAISISEETHPRGNANLGLARWQRMSGVVAVN